MRYTPFDKKKMSYPRIIILFYILLFRWRLPKDSETCVWNLCGIRF